MLKVNELEFNKIPNLAENDGLTCYKGHCAQQNTHAYQSFADLLCTLKPKRILEIGTGLGGFSFFLKTVTKDLNLDVDIRTYDINGRNEYKELSNIGVDVRVENIFNQDYTEVKQEVADFINMDGVTLVLCDGGYKIGEFNLLSKLIKKYDVIMAHDYCYDKDKFDNNINLKFWNWFEISNKDIENVCIEYDIHPYMQEMFNNSVWVCKIKNR